MINLQRVSDLKRLKSLLWFKPNEHHLWATIVADQATVGVIEFQPLTNATYSIHAHIFKKHQHIGFGNQIDLALNNFCVENGILTLIATVPATNSAIISVLDNSTFQAVCMIPNGIIYNNIVDNLIIYTRTGFSTKEVL